MLKPRKMKSSRGTASARTSRSRQSLRSFRVRLMKASSKYSAGTVVKSRLPETNSSHFG